MTQYKLTYFDMKGRAEPIRILFALAEVPFEDIRVSNESFSQMKSNLPYGELPILEIGNELRLSQSGAILRLLSKKFGFQGENDYESARIDEIVDACTDYAAVYWAYWGSTDPETKAKCVKNFIEIATPKYLGKFSQLLELNGGEYLVGNKLTWADIVVFNIIDYFEGLTQLKLSEDNYPILNKFARKFASLPGVEEWLAKRPKTSI